MYAIFVHETKGLSRINAYHFSRSDDAETGMELVATGVCDLTVCLAGDQRSALSVIGEELLNMSYRDMLRPPF
jgi:hypothetical protein